MKKVIEFIKWPLAFPALGSACLYLLWFITVPMELARFDDNFLNFTYGLLLFVIYFFATFFVKITYNSWKLSLGLLILLVPLTFLSISLIFLAFQIAIADLGNYRRELSAFFIITIFLIAYPASKFAMNLERNKIMRILLTLALFFLLCGNIVYMVAFFPKIEAKAQLENDKFFITSSWLWEAPFWGTNFYECETFSLSCDQLYHSDWYGAPKELLVDEQLDEVSLFTSVMSPRLVYTYGKNPRSYDGYPIQFGNHMYQISSNRVLPDECAPDKWRDCGFYVYTLYECNLDFKSCNLLPIQYIDETYGFFILEGNEETNEVEVYDDYKEDGGTLMFTYGEHPRCYVGGCEILDE